MTLPILKVKCPILNEHYRESSITEDETKINDNYPCYEAVIKYDSFYKPIEIMCRGFNHEKKCCFDGNEPSHLECIYSEWKSF